MSEFISLSKNQVLPESTGRSAVDELLLELFYEELPPSLGIAAQEGYRKIFKDFLMKHHIHYNLEEHHNTSLVDIKGEGSSFFLFATPRRIIISLTGLEIIEQVAKEIKGPKVGSSENALMGFCKSNNITLEDLSHQTINGYDYYVYHQCAANYSIEKIFAENLPQLIASFTWPKSMYWGNYNISAGRPLKNIMCLFNRTPLNFKYGHLFSNNYTYGHRSKGASQIIVSSYKEYCDKLMQQGVLIGFEERKQEILNQIDIKLLANNLMLKEDLQLLNEVTSLVEWPVVLVGKINQKYLSLPKEILILTMKTHQKYFTLLNREGELAPYFLFVSNVDSPNPEIIVQGNEKVLEARLADALFFYEQDCKSKLEKSLDKLSKMNFHPQLGNVAQKVERIKDICQYLDPENKDLQIAASLCKCDLVSNVVNELPELQGIMGYYYALNEGLSLNIADGIKDHYYPLGPNSKVPTGTAAKLALSDKLDSLVGLMLVGEGPTGSKDPFALRRSAIGIIRIIIDNKVNIDLIKLIDFIISHYQLNNDNVRQEIVYFLEERVKNHFKNEFEMNVIASCLDLKKEPDLLKIVEKFQYLQILISSKQGEEIIAAYKRVNNILKGKNTSSNINETRLQAKEEKILYQVLKEAQSNMQKSLINKDFEQSFTILNTLVSTINNFFDQVMINDENKDLANNRVALLSQIRLLFNEVINFDVI